VKTRPRKKELKGFFFSVGQGKGERRKGTYTSNTWSRRKLGTKRGASDRVFENPAARGRDILFKLLWGVG